MTYVFESDIKLLFNCIILYYLLITWLDFLTNLNKLHWKLINYTVIKALGKSLK